MRNGKKQVFSQSFTITQVTKEQIQELMSKYNLLSESETVRRAVAYMHERAFPDYIYKKTAKDIERRKEISQQQLLEEMGVDEFVERFIPGAKIVMATSGSKYVLLHGFANYLHPVPVEGIKSFYETDSDVVSLHLNKVKEISIDEELRPDMLQYLKDNYQIVLAPESMPRDEQETHSDQ